MNDRRKTLITIPVLDNDHVNEMEVKVYYRAGGYNHFRGTNDARGYVLSVTPQKRVDNGHFSSITTSPFTQGVKKLILEASRFGKKKFDSLLPTAEDLTDLLEHEVYRAELKLEHSIAHYVDVILGETALKQAA